jgi:hypothetical protein
MRCWRTDYCFLLRFFQLLKLSNFRVSDRVPQGNLVIDEISPLFSEFDEQASKTKSFVCLL